MKKVFLYIILLLTPVLHFSQSQISEEDRIHGLSLLWQEVNYNFAYFHQVEELDWDAAYIDAIKQLSSVETDYEYYRLLQKFMVQLNDGHTEVFLPDWISEQLIYPNIEVFSSEDSYYVTNVTPLLRKKLPIGSQILSINQMPIQDYLQQEIYPYIASSTDSARELFALDQLFVGFAHISFEVEITTAKGENESFSFSLDDDLTQKWVNEKKIIQTSIQSQSLGTHYLVELPSFEHVEMVEEFKALLPEINSHDAVIIDLRDNVGGQGVVALNIAQYFLQQDELITMPWKSRQHVASLKAWGNSGLQLVGYESVEKYENFGDLNAWIEVESDTLALEPTRMKIEVPIVVLTSERTASAAENFLVYVDQNPEITVIGTQTFGSTGQPIYFTLPGEAIARVCTKQNFTIEGQEFVGYGLQPDILHKLTLEDKLNQVDSQLERAVEFLEN